MQIALLATVVYMTAQVTAFFMPALLSSRLIPRATLTCPVANSTQCGNGLPGNFCCTSGSYCTILAHNTTAICCPDGSDCTAIAPLNCNIQVQNVAVYPTTVVMTTNLTATLSTCGSACCPLGYTCSNGVCNQNADQGNIVIKSSSTSRLPSSTTAAQPSLTSKASETSTQATPTTTSAVRAKYPTSAVLLGFFPGLVGGIILTLITVCLVGARAARRSSTSPGSPTSPSSPFSKVAASIFRDPLYPGRSGSAAHVRKSEISGPTLLRASTTTTGGRRLLNKNLFSASKTSVNKTNNIELNEKTSGTKLGHQPNNNSVTYLSEQDAFLPTPSSTTPMKSPYAYTTSPSRSTPTLNSATYIPTPLQVRKASPIATQHSRFISLDLGETSTPQTLKSSFKNGDGSENEEQSLAFAKRKIAQARLSHPVFPEARSAHGDGDEWDEGINLGSPKWGRDNGNEAGIWRAGSRESAGDVRKKGVVVGDGQREVGVMPGVRS